jgi:hypothetical protein
MDQVVHTLFVKLDKQDPGPIQLKLLDKAPAGPILHILEQWDLEEGIPRIALQ